MISPTESLLLRRENASLSSGGEIIVGKLVNSMFNLHQFLIAIGIDVLDHLPRPTRFITPSS